MPRSPRDNGIFKRVCRIKTFSMCTESRVESPPVYLFRSALPRRTKEKTSGSGSGLTYLAALELLLAPVCLLIHYVEGQAHDAYDENG